MEKEKICGIFINAHLPDTMLSEFATFSSLHIAAIQSI